MDDKPVVITVPTSLKRVDPFWHVFVALAAAVLAKATVDNYGVPWPLLVPPLLSVALWSLTSEEATDMRYVGWLAALLRSRLGQRRIDEWARAFAHYVHVAAGPRLKDKITTCRLEITSKLHARWLVVMNGDSMGSRLFVIARLRLKPLIRRGGGVST